MPIAIDKPSKYFNTVTWTGNSSTQSITGVGFSPDFIWKKSRSQAYSHRLSDNVRGGSKVLNTDNTNAEATDSNEVTSFDSDGFTLGNSYSNFTGHTHVGWCWDANGAGVSNTSGSITSTVSVNQTSGFSIVSYTGNGINGASIGHGLGKTPAMIIVKSRNDAEQWAVYHQSLGYTKYIVLQDTAGANSTARFYATPTSNVFYVDTGYGVNKSSSTTYIAYCFAEVKGFSKFGSYTGNGSNDGTFIYTGFKPAFFMYKRTDAAGYNWIIYDNKRDTYNYAYRTLFPNSSAADPADTLNAQDIVSNGFKLRNTYENASGSNYIYMAFAENPFVSSKGIPTTAR